MHSKQRIKEQVGKEQVHVFQTELCRHFIRFISMEAVACYSVHTSRLSVQGSCLFHMHVFMHVFISMCYDAVTVVLKINFCFF